MKKLFPFIALAGAACIGLSGCSAIVGGQSAASETLTVYTVTGPEVTEPLVEAFEADNPDIKVEVITSAGTGELMARVESEAKNPLGDVVWGGSTENYEAVGEGIFEAVELDNDSKMVMSDPEHYWHATDLLYQVIAVNTDRVPDKSAWPTTMMDLTDPSWGELGGIGFATPRSSGTTYSLLAAMVSEYDWDYIEAFLPNAVLLDGSSAMFNGTRTGEYAAGFINEDLAATWAADGSPIEVIYPTDVVSNQVGAAAVIAGSANQANAETFVNYLMSEKGQEVIRDAAGRRPARVGVTPPTGLPDAADLNLATPDPEQFAVGKEEALAKFDELAGTN